MYIRTDAINSGISAVVPEVIWSKKYKNQSIMVVELFPQKIYSEFLCQFPVILLSSNFSLTAISFCINHDG